MLNRVIFFESINTLGGTQNINPKTDVRRLEVYIEAKLTNSSSNSKTVTKEDFCSILHNVKVVSKGKTLHDLSGADIVAMARRYNGNDPLPEAVEIAAGDSKDISLYFPIECNAVIDDVQVKTAVDGISDITIIGKGKILGNSRVISDFPVRTEKVTKNIAVGQLTENKDSILAPVTGIVVRGGSALEELQIKGTLKDGSRVNIVDNLPIDYLTAMEKYETDLEYSPDGEWGIIFDEPVEVDALQFEYTGNATGTLNIIVIY